MHQTKQTCVALHPDVNCHDHSDVLGTSHDLDVRREVAGERINCDISCFSEGALIFENGQDADSIYQVLSGAVLLSRPVEGSKMQILEAIGDRGIFGIVTNSKYEYRAEDMTRTIVRRVSYSAIRESIEAHVLITEQLVSSLARMRDRAVYYGHKATPRLLASALLSMPKCTGVRLQVDARHKILDLRIMMSEAELANYLGVTQQTVSRVLANLKADGIVSMQSRRLLTIRDRDKLERLAAGDKYRPHPSCFYGEDHRAETRSNTGVQK